MQFRALDVCEYIIRLAALQKEIYAALDASPHDAPLPVWRENSLLATYWSESTLSSSR